jgi:dihydrodipicolinate reductase
MPQNQQLTVCMAGATGWTGRALVRGVLDAPDLTLRSAVSRSAAGRDLGEALGEEALGVPIYATVREALDGIDVLIDYTSVTAVKDNALAAYERLTIRHDAGGTPEPYVAGTLIAVRQAPLLVGLTRGLDALLLAES